MAKIGSLGSTINFIVSDKKVLTFNSLNQNVKGRWSQHQNIGKLPSAEFLGADTRDITLTIQLNAMNGIKPRKTMEKIEKAVLKGTPLEFVIGGKKIGKNRFVIQSMSEAWGTILSKGELVSATLQLTLKEYV